MSEETKENEVLEEEKAPETPPEVQKVSVFSAGITVSSKAPDAARALIQFLASPAALPVILENGLEPVTSR